MVYQCVFRALLYVVTCNGVVVTNNNKNGDYKLRMDTKPGAQNLLLITPTYADQPRFFDESSKFTIE